MTLYFEFIMSFLWNPEIEESSPLYWLDFPLLLHFWSHVFESSDLLLLFPITSPLTEFPGYDWVLHLTSVISSTRFQEHAANFLPWNHTHPFVTWSFPVFPPIWTWFRIIGSSLGYCSQISCFWHLDIFQNLPFYLNPQIWNSRLLYRL